MMKSLRYMFSFLFAMTIGFQMLYAQADLSTDIQRAGEALRRYMESAHPTPDIGKDIPMTPMVPMITNALNNPSFFDDVNMIIAETDQLPVQNESSIAVNPTNPRNLIGSAVDYRASSSAWVYYSMDGGRTWKNVNLGKPPKMTTSSNDPSVAFNRNGTGYLVYGAFGDRTKASPENGVFFSRTTDGGVTWTKHIPVIQHLGEQTPDSTFEDKYYIWVDNSPNSPYANRLYIPWKRVINRDSSTQIVNVYSTDNGNTWSTPVPVSDRVSGISEDTTFGQSFPLTVTGPDGEVYTVWNYGPKSSIGFAKSLDGGNTFSKPRLVQTYRSFGKAKALDEGVRHTVKGGVRAEAYPSLTCDITNGPRRGWLYLAWSADSIPNVYVSRSTDKGETWSTPKIVHSTETNDQFWHWITIDPVNGDLGIMYLDSRDDPNNIITNCYVSYSRDGGDTWMDRRASEAQSDLRNNPFKNNVFAGDYSGCTMYDGIIYPSWVDMRNAATSKIDNDAYTSIVNTRIPQPAYPFTARPSSVDTTSIRLFWKAPKARVFDQPLDAPIRFVLTRNNTFLAEVPGDRETYLDTTVVAFRTYVYGIRVIAGSDTSAMKEAKAIAGGAKLPQMPTLSSSRTIGNMNIIELSLRIPGFRADTITPFINPGKLTIFRDGARVREFPLSITDTGMIRTFNDTLPIEGWYEYAFTISDKSALESARTPMQVLFGGPVTSSFTESFDGDELRAYYSVGRFASTSAFAFSTPNALTESPNGQYIRNARDTFMLMPVQTAPNMEHAMRFRHAAIVDITDSAFVEWSQDRGNSWQVLSRFDKTQFAPWADSITNPDDWKPEILSFTPKSDTTLFRFRFWSGPSFQEDGWWIDDIIIGRTTTIAESNQLPVSIYPLPAKDFVTITLNETDDIQWRIFDIMGSEIDQEAVLGELHDGYVLLNVQNLATGAYTIQIKTGGRNIGTYPMLISK
ncbi:MAG: T9SS type A sorting domain-containing protein [Bacteroidota bacterium]